MTTIHSSSIPKGQIPVRIKGHTKCPYHKENEVVLLCRDCSLLICTTCSITTHKTHIDSFCEIARIAHEQQSTLQGFINQTDNTTIPELKNGIQSSRKEMSTSESHYSKLSVNIKAQRDNCKEELDKITEDYLAICDKMEKTTTDLLQTRITNLEDRLATLEKLSSECKQTLQTGTAVLMYDSVSEIKDIDLDIPQTPDIDIPEFTPGNNRRSHLEQVIGRIKIHTDILQTGSAQDNYSEQGSVLPPELPPRLRKSDVTCQVSSGADLYKLYDSPTVLSQFSYPDYVTSICPTSDGRAWLCYQMCNTANLINNKGQVLQKVQHNSGITKISLDPTTGRLWFCCFKDNTIYEISLSSTPVKRFTTEGCPYSLCVTREGRVVVGTDEDMVVLYTADGQVLQTAPVDGVVGHACECGVTGNIAVASRKHISGDGSDPNNYRRHIIVYNQTLQSLFHYRGEGIQAREAVTPDKFVPLTVVYDTKGNVVIADMTRKTIELISGSGKYIQTLHTNKRRQGPVGIQKDDVLWSCLELDTGERGLKLLKYYSD